MKSKVLFIVQLPPPVHGSSIMNETIISNKVVKKHFHIDILQIQLAKNMQDLGRFSLIKVVKGISIFFHTFKRLLFNKYDLIYLTLSPLSFAFYKDALLILLVKLFKRKIVLHLHGKGIRNQTKNRFKKRIYEAVFKNTSVIILADNLYQDIDNIYTNKPYILANGVPKQKHPKNELKTIEDNVEFIYLSNLTKAKGILILLKSILNLKNVSKTFNITIIGPSADVTIQQVESFTLKHKLDNVKVIGPIYGDMKNNYLKKADVFILPSEDECFPISILEAYQAGLAVITTNVGGIPELVKNNINGYLIPPKSSLELSLAMKKMIDNRNHLENFKINNFKDYENKYTEEIFINNFITIIDDILKK